jgi:hypothetical protein
VRANVAEYDITEVWRSRGRPVIVPNLSVKNVRVAVLRASD